VRGRVTAFAFIASIAATAVPIRTEESFFAAHASRRGSLPPGITGCDGDRKENFPCPSASGGAAEGGVSPSRCAQDAGTYAGCTIFHEKKAERSHKEIRTETEKGRATGTSEGSGPRPEGQRATEVRKGSDGAQEATGNRSGTSNGNETQAGPGNRGRLGIGERTGRPRVTGAERGSKRI
jgi:hypothetical protein